MAFSKYTIMSIHRLLLISITILIAGCPGGNSSSNRNNNDPVTTSGNPGNVISVLSAMNEPRMTLNNPWTTGQTDHENINSRVTWQGQPFTTWKDDYLTKKAECESYDGKTVDKDGSSGTTEVCIPTKKAIADCGNGTMLEYGYYCGAGRPGVGLWGKEPLDGVDYCCYLHDRRVWGDQSNSDLACGAIMCMYNATVYPAGAEAFFPEVENARQCLHDKAAILCGGNQSNDSPAPTVEYNP
jgi:hypothetical protein